MIRSSSSTGKKTEDGLPIYDTSELKIGLGGGKFSFSVSLSYLTASLMKPRTFRCRYGTMSLRLRMLYVPLAIHPCDLKADFFNSQQVSEQLRRLDWGHGVVSFHACCNTAAEILLDVSISRSCESTREVLVVKRRTSRNLCCDIASDRYSRARERCRPAVRPCMSSSMDGENLVTCEIVLSLFPFTSHLTLFHALFLPLLFLVYMPRTLSPDSSQSEISESSPEKPRSPTAEPDESTPSSVERPIVLPLACMRYSPRPCVNQGLVDALKPLRDWRFAEFGCKSPSRSCTATKTHKSRSGAQQREAPKGSLIRLPSPRSLPVLSR